MKKRMGRRRHSKHGQKRQSQKSKRRGGRSEPLQPLQRVHGSDPERGGREGTPDSPIWNSLDEQSLAGLSPPPSLSALVAADYVYKSGLSSDEMEVTRKLSCLNFSVLPCSADTLMLSRNEQTSSHRRHHQDGVHSCRAPAGESLTPTIQAADMSDVEPYSELVSATQPCVPLPTYDHNDEGVRLLEDMDCEQRRRRKRASRKKPNRRTKKMRLHHHSENSTIKSSIIQPLSTNFIHGHPMYTDVKDKEGLAVGKLRRTRSFRRSKRQSRPEQSDPMLCILSDTSAMCELDHDKELMVEDDFFDCTPPAEGIPSIGMMMEGLGCISGPTVSLEELPNESDLTETTSDRCVELLAQ